MSSIEDRVRSIIADQLGLSEDEIKPEASFIEDLGADSLDIVELIMAMEDEFQTDIPDEEAEKIRTVLSEVLLREVRDPRVQGVTVMEVRVDRELQYADVYVHAFDEEGNEAAVLAGLASASGFLRKRVADSLRTRSVPRLHFHWDPTLAYGDRMDAVLDEILWDEEE